MAYKKPQIVAKSAAKQTFVAGCPEKTQKFNHCTPTNKTCQCGPVK